MTLLYVAEYSGVASVDANGVVLAMPQPPIAEQVVDYTAGAAASAPFNPLTTFVELSTDDICSVAFGVAPVATTTNARMAADERRIVGVPAGQGFQVSAITNT